MTKLIALSEAPEHTWFATSVLFDWAAEFLLSRVADPALREQLHRGAASGYLYLDTVPEPQRAPLLRALREDLPAAVDRSLYSRPLDLHAQEPLMAARLKTLTAMAWSYDESQARRGTPLVLVLAPALRVEVAHGLQPTLVSFLRRHAELPLPADPDQVDLGTLPDPQRTQLLRALRDDLHTAVADDLLALDPAAARWSRTELRTLTLQAGAALGA